MEVFDALILRGDGRLRKVSIRAFTKKEGQGTNKSSALFNISGDRKFKDVEKKLIPEIVFGCW